MRNRHQQFNKTFTAGFTQPVEQAKGRSLKVKLAETMDFSSRIYRTFNMGQVLYDFQEGTPVTDKLIQLEESFYRIPPVIVRDLAYLPERTIDRQHMANEEKIVNLSERFRKSINRLRRFSYVNPTLLDEKYLDNRDVHTTKASLNQSFLNNYEFDVRKRDAASARRAPEASAPLISTSPPASKLSQLFQQTRTKINALKQMKQMQPRKQQTSTSELSEKEAPRARRERRHAFSDLRKVSNYVNVMPIQSKDTFPVWMRDRQDFLRMYYSSQIQEHLDIPKICGVVHEKRTLEDQMRLVKYLKGLDVLANLKAEFYQHLGQHLISQVYIEGEPILQHGQEVQYLSILYEGRVTKQHKNGTSRTYTPVQLLNRRYAIRPTPVDYELQAETNVILLSISCAAYNLVLSECLAIYSKDFTSILARTTFFHSFEYETLEKISQLGKLTLFFKGEIIQDFDEMPNHFSIIFQGRAKCQWYHETYQQNKWPNRKRSWEIKTICKRNIVADQLQETEFFGDDEIINDSLTRTRIIAEENSFLIQITRDHFMDIFSADDLILFRRHRNGKIQEQTQLNLKDDKAARTRDSKQRKKRLEEAMTLIFSQAQTQQELDKKRKRFKRFQDSLGRTR